jgi:hypothetical protein
MYNATMRLQVDTHRITDVELGEQLPVEVKVEPVVVVGPGKNCLKVVDLAHY